MTSSLLFLKVYFLTGSDDVCIRNDQSYPFAHSTLNNREGATHAKFREDKKIYFKKLISYLKTTTTAYNN